MATISGTKSVIEAAEKIVMDMIKEVRTHTHTLSLSHLQAEKLHTRAFTRPCTTVSSSFCALAIPPLARYRAFPPPPAAALLWCAAG